MTDGVPAVDPGFEEAERDVMKRSPYNPQQSVFARGLSWPFLVMGLIIGLMSVGTGYWFWYGGTGRKGGEKENHMVKAGKTNYCFSYIKADGYH